MWLATAALWLKDFGLPMDKLCMPKIWPIDVKVLHLKQNMISSVINGLIG